MTTASDQPDSTSGAPILTGADLHLDFGQTRALRGAGLSVCPGEIVAVMGTSGSGKSTLLHCLAGILSPKSGSVTFAGREVTAMTDVERSALRRSEFGFVFQFGQLVPELSIVENVALPLRLCGVKGRQAAVDAKGWLDRLDVAHIADHRPGEISGGQGQRVAIARALVARPKVIFADEPTGALDTLQGEQVMTLLTETARETDAAVVLVTHEPTVAAFADREVIVRDGMTRSGEIKAEEFAR
ncbi:MULTISPECIES: ABC transporter ATP-binding protein [Actinoalloteichus]|uniref:ABC-type antimicrobial peptide transport system, ATPase component n=1 Tax=Actinoalloteichus fjordicus TaxID=1612552 RepID=A0AAC9PV24_9PSEU|nr:MULTISPECIES: ABC transporter ATP-binding protein [Actinoalloteichus]APU17722.1 ABC-type antimicrobial peptide transport system, ATPase component [Actinoalloteichus fjordicus]APU23800.1 ABC-type antimicrobial peptide transport system, ATPase component [Actinoalloteichus sp. GBA129-24]